MLWYATVTMMPRWQDNQLSFVDLTSGQGSEDRAPLATVGLAVKIGPANLLGRAASFGNFIAERSRRTHAKQQDILGNPSWDCFRTVYKSCQPTAHCNPENSVYIYIDWL